MVQMGKQLERETSRHMTTPDLSLKMREGGLPSLNSTKHRGIFIKITITLSALSYLAIHIWP